MAFQLECPRPAAFHTDRLREQPVGYLYDVITNGYGRMMDYKEQVSPADRWAIVAYIRALQKSQFVEQSSLSESDLRELRKPTETNMPSGTAPQDQAGE